MSPGEPYFFLKTIGPMEAMIWGKMCPKMIFCLSFSWYGVFWGKSFKAVFGTPFPIEMVIFIFVVGHHVPWKMVMTLKNYFSRLFQQILLSKKYSKPHFLQKSLRWFLSPNASFPSKWSCPPTNGFSQFFQHKLKNIREVFLLESMLIRKKILWRINFALIKFSTNALLFEKLQNECKNSSFLHKVTCIRSDHADAVAKFHIHGFILQETLV